MLTPIAEPAPLTGTITTATVSGGTATLNMAVSDRWRLSNVFTQVTVRVTNSQIGKPLRLYVEYGILSFGAGLVWDGNTFGAIAWPGTDGIGPIPNPQAGQQGNFQTITLEQVGEPLGGSVAWQGQWVNQTSGGGV